jgi:rhamnose utilization protein RhaD (predicted bifunctional aldolase and dehydrogenase)
MGNWKHATMDVKTAMQGIKRAIMALEDSAPVYRTDNLDMLNELNNRQRRAFFSARLQLAKLAAAGRSTPDIVLQTFTKTLV